MSGKKKEDYRDLGAEEDEPMMVPQLSDIWIYPIKSLDGVCVRETAFVPGGGLKYDRQWGIFAPAGRFINGKEVPQLHQIRSRFTPEFDQVTLSTPNLESQSFELSNLGELSAWFSDFLHKIVEVKCNAEIGFPDDLDFPGPTLISQASLETMASWFPGLSAEDLRRRLRPNLIIDQVPAFEEDRLVGPPGSLVPFWLGKVPLLGCNPCQRCAVPARDPLTGDIWTKFQLEFARQREATLPAWANRSRFNHFYRAALNTQLATSVQEGNFQTPSLAVGDLYSRLD